LSIRELVKVRKRVPVLIIERNEVGRRLFFSKKYANKLLFIGKLPVLSLLCLGLWAIMMWCGGRFHQIIQDELLNILSYARLDEASYQVMDFFVKGNRLIIYVSAGFPRLRTENSMRCRYEAEEVDEQSTEQRFSRIIPMLLVQAKLLLSLRLLWALRKLLRLWRRYRSRPTHAGD